MLDSYTSRWRAPPSHVWLKLKARRPAPGAHTIALPAPREMRPAAVPAARSDDSASLLLLLLLLPALFVSSSSTSAVTRPLVLLLLLLP